MHTKSYALIFYRPGTQKTKNRVFYNEEAWHILSRSAPLSDQEMASFPDLYPLCSRWKALLDRNLDESKGPSEASEGVNIVDVLQSGQRRYAVRGSILSVYPSAQGKEKQYIFVLERFNLDKLNLPMVFRQWNLNPREQDMVRLLLKGQSNKEIAQTLDLSLNTVKSYMKLLSRKIGSSGRTHLISRLISGK
jgi:DNA-binding CsgD family transcriptional regulator